RPVLTCAALAPAAIALAGGCGSSAADFPGPGGGDASGPLLDGSTSPDGTIPADASFDASACQPGDISDFKFAWKSPTGFHQGACASNGAQTPLWVRFYADCLGSKRDKARCGAFTDPSGPYYKCGQCLATMDTADHYGPLIVHTGWIELNVAGCLADAMNDPSGIKCGSSVQAV